MNITNRSCAVFNRSVAANLDLIKLIKKYFTETNTDNDFFIFSDIINNISFNDIAIMQSYYLKFYQGTVVFLDIKDYLDNIDSLCEKIIFLDQQNISQADILKQGTKILTIENNLLRLIEK